MSTRTGGIQINQGQLQDVQRMLSGIQNGAKKAIVKAINNSASSTKSRIETQLYSKLTAKKADIKSHIEVKKASYDKLSCKVTMKGKPIPLNKYRTGKQLRAGIKTKVYSSSPLRMIYGAFYAQMRNGHEGVFLRKYTMNRHTHYDPAVQKKVSIKWLYLQGRKYRLPIKELYGPRFEDILAKPEIIDPIQSEAGDLLVRFLDIEVSELLRRNAL